MHRNESSITFDRQSEILPGDFAFLPNEVAYDVVDSGGTSRKYSYYELRNLSKIEGSWGEFARKLSACTMQENGLSESSTFFRSRAYALATRSARAKEIPFEEARNRDICSSSIARCFDLEQLMAVAPQLYDTIYFSPVPDTYCKVLVLMGTRFTTITWRGGNPKEPAMPELVNFLRRQLQSSHLRNLTVYNDKIKDGVLDDHLAVFVARPWFEKLHISICLVPFKVIEGAHKAWEAPKLYVFKKRVIFVHISKETLGKIEELFEFKFEFEFEKGVREEEISKLIIDHPEESNASVCLAVREDSDQYWLQMDICDL